MCTDCLIQSFVGDLLHDRRGRGSGFGDGIEEQLSACLYECAGQCM